VSGDEAHPQLERAALLMQMAISQLPLDEHRALSIATYQKVREANERSRLKAAAAHRDAAAAAEALRQVTAPSPDPEASSLLAAVGRSNAVGAL
jgi:hypothetical protein